MRSKFRLVLRFVNKNRVLSPSTHLKIVETWTGKWCICAWSKNSVFIPLIIFPVEFNIVQIKHLIPACGHVLCAYTWGHLVPHLHSPSLLGVIGTRVRWLLKNSCLWDNNKFKAVRGISWEIIVISWKRSFTVRITESGPNSRDHSLLSLET